MACNLPVVSVPVGDTVKQLEGVYGYRIVERDVLLIGEALAMTIQENLIPQGRDAILKRGLDLVSVAQRIEGIYRDILN
jgi:hypothetical protein